MGRDSRTVQPERGETGLNDNDRKPIGVNGLRSNFNPATAGWALIIEGKGEYPCETLNVVQDGASRWLFDVRTADPFAGPAVPSGFIAGAAVLNYGSYRLEVKATQGDYVVTHGISFPLVVRR